MLTERYLMAAFTHSNKSHEEIQRTHSHFFYGPSKAIQIEQNKIASNARKYIFREGARTKSHSTLHNLENLTN